MYQDAIKRPATHVSLQAVRQSWLSLCRWQACVQAAVAFASDGGWALRRNEEGFAESDGDGSPLYVSARASFDHNGVVVSGQLEELEGDSAYLAELRETAVSRMSRAVSQLSICATNWLRIDLDGVQTHEFG